MRKSALTLTLLTTLAAAPIATCSSASIVPSHSDEPRMAQAAMWSREWSHDLSAISASLELGDAAVTGNSEAGPIGRLFLPVADSRGSQSWLTVQANVPHHPASADDPDPGAELVPEPTALILLGVGLMGLLLVKNRS